MFYIGQKVVCVDADFSMYSHIKVETYPVKNGIYTVRGIRNKALFLEEIVNTPRLYPGKTVIMECAFKMERFRPVQTTNIDIFKEMCKNPDLELIE